MSVILSWKKIELIIDNIRFDHKYDTILAVSRGGLVPAAMIANKLDIRNVITVQASSYSNGSKKELKVEKISLPKDPGRILVVDDIIDTGDTIAHVVDQIPEEYDVTVLAIALRYGCPLIKGVSYGIVVPKDEWVHFPWEGGDPYV